MTPKNLQLCVDLDWPRVQYPCVVEPKIDGFRCLVTVDDDGTVHAWSRSCAEWPKIAAALSGLSRFPGQWFDGELVIGGSWAATNAAKNRGWEFDADDLEFVVFDGRVDLLGGFTTLATADALPRFEHVTVGARLLARDRAEVELMYRAALQKGFEGIVVKRLNAPYAAGRTGNWMKLKPQQTNDVQQPDGTWHETLNGAVVRVRDDK